MLPAELMKQIRALEIRTRGAVEEITGGAYRSVFKGRGIEFDEVREYSDSDDARDIDWNVSARMGAPYVKKYVEERELNVLLAVDVSASGAFGSGEKSKRQSAAELAALLAFSAGSNHDKVGLLLFSDRMELYLPPKSGRKNTLRLIRELLAYTPQHTGTDIGQALREIRGLLHKRSVVFLISDFADRHDYGTALRLAGRRHDVIAVRITDPLEQVWPFSCAVEAEDSETGRTVSFSGTAGARFAYENAAAQESAKCAERCAQSGVDLVELVNGEDTLKPLIAFFDRRQARLARHR